MLWKVALRASRLVILFAFLRKVLFSVSDFILNAVVFGDTEVSVLGVVVVAVDDDEEDDDDGEETFIAETDETLSLLAAPSCFLGVVVGPLEFWEDFGFLLGVVLLSDGESKHVEEEEEEDKDLFPLPLLPPLSPGEWSLLPADLHSSTSKSLSALLRPPLIPFPTPPPPSSI